MSDKCPLCDLRVRTKNYIRANDEQFWLVDCQSCGVPMIVWKRHGDRITRQEAARAIQLIWTHFGECEIRTQGRKVTDHVHWHVYPLNRPVEVREMVRREI